MFGVSLRMDLKYMKKITFITFCMLLIISESVYASLIGTDVLFEHRYNDRIDVSDSIIVLDSFSNTANLLLGTDSKGPLGYNVQMNSNEIFIDFYTSSGVKFFNGGTINGLIITSDFLDIDEFLSSAFITHNSFGFSNDRITKFSENSIALDFQGKNFYNSSSLNISFTQPVSVNEPSMLLIFMTGLLFFFSAKAKYFKKSFFTLTINN